VDDVAAAMNVLEATNWALEEAINLQFATGGDVGGGGGGGGGAHAGGAADLPPLEEENVRAPLPVMRDRLYGDVGMHGVPGRGGVVARCEAWHVRPKGVLAMPTPHSQQGASQQGASQQGCFVLLPACVREALLVLKGTATTLMQQQQRPALV
jgi:hypothetical protein